MTGGTLDQVDAGVPRFNQAMVAALTALAFVIQIWQLVAVVLAVIGLNRGACSTSRWSSDDRPRLALSAVTRR